MPLFDDVEIKRRTLNRVTATKVRRVTVPGGSGTIHFDPFKDGGHLVITIGINTAVITVNLVTNAGYTPVDGDKITVTLKMPVGHEPSSPLTITWPGTFKFSGDDRQPPGNNTSPNTYYINWQFHYLAAPDDVWLAIRSDY